MMNAIEETNRPRGNCQLAKRCIFSDIGPRNADLKRPG
jgi:hypothetical protein